MNTIELQNYQDSIRSCCLFRDLTETELASLLQDEGVSVMKCARNTVLNSDRMYVVISGTVIIEKIAADGRIITLGNAGSHAAINAASVFLNGQHMSRLTTTSESVLLVLNRQAVVNALSLGTSFAVNLAEFLSGRISFLNNKISSLAGYSASCRLHLYLVDNCRDNKVVLPMSLTAFAEYLGVGRASLYRTLERMEKDGSITRKGRTIYINELSEKGVIS